MLLWLKTPKTNQPSWLYNATPLGDQVAHTVTWYPTQSHYPDTQLTSPYPILIMLSTRLGSDKYPFWKSLIWLDRDSNPRPFAVLCSTDLATVVIGSYHMATIGSIPLCPMQKPVGVAEWVERLPPVLEDQRIRRSRIQVRSPRVWNLVKSNQRL